MLAVFHSGEPAPGFGIAHGGSAERPPGTLNGTEQALNVIVPPVLFLLR